MEVAVGAASPSTVVTDAPSAWAANIVQESVASPSTSTVQAPQLEVSQPDVRAGQPELLPQEVHEQETRLDVPDVLLAVDGDRDGASHRHLRRP